MLCVCRSGPLIFRSNMKRASFSLADEDAHWSTHGTKREKEREPRLTFIYPNFFRCLSLRMRRQNPTGYSEKVSSC